LIHRVRYRESLINSYFRELNNFIFSDGETMRVGMGSKEFLGAHWKPALTRKTISSVFVSGTRLLFDLFVEDWDHLALMTVFAFFHGLCQ